MIQKTRGLDAALPMYIKESVGEDLIKKLVQLSRFEDGPKRAVELLNTYGIAVVFEPQLKGTMLDGAALKDLNGRPIIALTLRYDRLDNFWFTIVHELVHVWKHIDDVDEAILDDLDHSTDERREVEANRIARDAFIPRSLWKRTDAYLKPSKASPESVLRSLEVVK
ncbi:hypothetical protein D3C76_917580 [compost metagenome]